MLSERVQHVLGRKLAPPHPSAQARLLSWGAALLSRLEHWLDEPGDNPPAPDMSLPNSRVPWDVELVSPCCAPGYMEAQMLVAGSLKGVR